MSDHLNTNLLIKSKIWEKETYELVDYDNPDTIKTKIKVDCSGSLSRVNNQTMFSKTEKFEKNPFELLRVKRNPDNGKFYINCGNWSKNLSELVEQTGAFIVYKSHFFKEIKNVKEQFYKLSQGDILKLGRIYLKILEIKLKSNSEADNKKNDDSTVRKTIINTSSFNSAVVNGQEIIRGAFTPNKNGKKINFDLSGNNLISESQNNSIFCNSNDIRDNLSYKSFQNNNHENIINSNLKNKNNTNMSWKKNILPRINSHGELFMVKEKNKKEKKNEKPKKNPQKKQKIDLITETENIESSSSNIENINNNKQKKAILCRICYGDEHTIENPLIYPCTCKGSMKYIHYECLKNWLNSKIETDISGLNETNIITYSTKDICCELCKSKFPDYVKYKGKLYNISFYKPKFSEYIIFESMRVDKNHNKYIHIVSFTDRNILNVGRASDCEFSLPELSVSRFHCMLYRHKGELYLEDNKSKFGSLILVQNNNLLMNDYLPLKLQINKTYIKLRMNLPLFFTCCNANTRELKKYDYQKQNATSLDILATFVIKENDSELNIDDEEDEKSLIDNETKNKNKKINKKVKKVVIKNKKLDETKPDNNKDQNLPALNKINLTPLENNNLELLALSGINNNQFSELNNHNLSTVKITNNNNTTNNPFAQQDDKNRVGARININSFFNGNLANNSNLIDQNSGIISPVSANQNKQENNDNKKEDDK